MNNMVYLITMVIYGILRYIYFIYTFYTIYIHQPHIDLYIYIFIKTFLWKVFLTIMSHK